MNQENDETRENLYNKFRRQMLLDPKEAYFDECDLIEIFDYAGDKDDDAVRTEVIALAQRLFPDSEALRIRKALFYFYMDQPGMARAIAEAPHEPGILWDILQLRLDTVPDEEVDERLRAIVDRYPALEDEAVIQLVDVANSLGHLDWVTENIDYLRPKVSYLPTLLYEVAMLAGMAEDYEVVVKFMDELTGIEPFYAPYWMMLARAHAEMFNNAEALAAVDYALAIDPDLEEAILMKAHLMLLLDQDVNAILPDVKRIVDLSPYNIAALRTLWLIYRNLNMDDEAYVLYARPLYRDPGNDALVEDALELPYIDVNILMTRYYEAREDTPETHWMELASKMSKKGRHDIAWKVLKVFHEKDSLLAGFSQYIVELYLDGQYKTVEKVLSTKGEVVRTPYFSPIVSLAYAFAMVRNGRTRKVEHFIDSWIERNKMALFPSPAARVESTGVLYYMHQLYEWMFSEDPEPLDRLDPFHAIRTDFPQLY